MSRCLPPRPTMDHLRKEAKAILRAHQTRDLRVLPTLRRLAQFARLNDAEVFSAKVALREAQYALALEYGFVSWEKLKERVEASAPPLHANPPARWFHGSDRQLDHLRAGSTVTPIIELAKAFAHQPRNVSIQNHESGDQNHRRVEIVHDGQKDGYLYEVEVPDPTADLRPHPESTLAPGEEMLTTREPSVTLLESLPLADSLRQEYEEPLMRKDAVDRPEYRIVEYGPGDVAPAEVESLFSQELAEIRGVMNRQQPDRVAWRFACLCAVISDDHVLGGVHFDMGPINDGPLADERVAVLEKVYVRPEHRRRGIATALMTRAVDVARLAKCSHMRGNTRWDNPAEIALFRRTGFALTDINDGDRGGYYFTVRPL